MLKKNSNAVCVVHDEEVLWISTGPSDAGRCMLRLPLDQVVSDEGIAERIPKSIRGNHKHLCIVPDHWLGMERYAFQSTRPSLIEPFLERKLSAAFPECRQIQHFFNYQSLPPDGFEGGLMAYFLQEEKGYRLYDALEQLDLAPRRITAPAFLWLDGLSQSVADFDRQGTLLIHMGGRECSLYFYSKGHFIFSRNVALAEGPDRLEALTFEINQSLYMFSQKTKTELNRVYLLAGPGETCESFGEMLGRDVIDLQPILKGISTIASEALPFLDGLLPSTNAIFKTSFFSLAHRRVKRELEWEPVQWAGILVGALLLLLLMGENLVLSRMLRQEHTASRIVEQQATQSAASLTDYEQALDRVLEAAERPVCADEVRRLLAGLPAGMQLQALDMDLEEQPAVKLTAKVRVGSTEQLKALLASLAARVKADFKSAQQFSINDIQVSVDPGATTETLAHYVIALRLELI